MAFYERFEFRGALQRMVSTELLICFCRHGRVEFAHAKAGSWEGYLPMILAGRYSIALLLAFWG